MNNDRQQQLNQDIDAMLYEQATSLPPDDDYAAMLSVARQLKNADFSGDSQIKDDLRKRLLSAEQKRNRSMLYQDTLRTNDPARRSLLMGALAAVVLLVGFAIFAAVSGNLSPEPMPEDQFGAYDQTGPDRDVPVQQSTATQIFIDPTMTPSVTPSALPPTAGMINPSIVPSSTPFPAQATYVPTPTVSPHGIPWNPNTECLQFSRLSIRDEGVIIGTDATLYARLPDPQNEIYYSGSGATLTPTTTPNSPNVDTVYPVGSSFVVLSSGSCVDGVLYVFVRMDEDGRQGWLKEVTYEYGLLPRDQVFICEPLLESRLEAGDRGVISENMPNGVRLYPDYNTFIENGEIYPAGATLTVLEGLFCRTSADGQVSIFREVQMEDGTIGWIAEIMGEQYLVEPLESSAQEICTPALPPRLVVSGRGRILPVAADGLRLRPEPSTFNEPIGTYPPGTTFTVINGYVCQDEGTDQAITFFQVEIDENGQLGWFSESSGGEYVVEPLRTVVALGLGCAEELPTRLEVGGSGRVLPIAADGIRLRPEPSSFNEPIGTYPPGTTFTVIDGYVCQDEDTDQAFTFYQVEMADGQQGWLSETFSDGYTVEPIEE